MVPKLRRPLIVAATGLVVLGLGMFEFGAGSANAAPKLPVGEWMVVRPAQNTAGLEHILSQTSQAAPFVAALKKHVRPSVVGWSDVILPGRDTQPELTIFGLKNDGHLGAGVGPSVSISGFGFSGMEQQDGLAYTMLLGGQTQSMVQAIDSGFGAQIVNVTYAGPTIPGPVTPPSSISTPMDFSFPAGLQWSKRPSGALWLSDAKTGIPVLVVDAPWAIDANGKALRTNYVRQGQQIVQKIDSSHAAFPVVSGVAAWQWYSTARQCVLSLYHSTDQIEQVGAKAAAKAHSNARLAKAYKTLAVSPYAATNAWNGLWGMMSALGMTNVHSRQQLVTQNKALQVLAQPILKPVLKQLNIPECNEIGAQRLA